MRIAHKITEVNYYIHCKVKFTNWSIYDTIKLSFPSLDSGNVD